MSETKDDNIAAQSDTDARQARLEDYPISAEDLGTDEISPELLGDKSYAIVNYLGYFGFHFAYISLVWIIGSIFLFSIENGRADTVVNGTTTSYSLSVIDALFMSAAAVTEAGLETVDTSALSIHSQVTLFFVIIFGGMVISTIPTIVVRWCYLARVRREAHKEGYSTGPDAQGVLQDLDTELRASKYLFFIVLGYYIMCHFVICMCLWIYVVANSEAYSLLTDIERPVNPFWFAIFHTVSGFQNAGLSIMTTNLLVFQSHGFVLFMVSFAILLGNTAYPLALRFIVHVIKSRTRNPDRKKVLRYLSKKSRAMYTHLFNWEYTRALMLPFFVMLFLAVIIFLIRESGEFSGATLFYSAWFQSVSTRTAGFSSVDFSRLSSGVLFLMLALMYITSYPMLLAIRNTAVTVANANASDGKAKHATLLNIEAEEDTGEEEQVSKYAFVRFLDRLHVRRWGRELRNNVLLFDLVVLYLGSWLIMLFGERAFSESAETNIFSTVFELVSAYGTVGFSMGAPGQVYSYSGVFNWFQKLVVIIVMLLGRHRGLPSARDPAILPGRLVDWRLHLRSRNRIETEKALDEEHLDFESQSTALQLPRDSADE